MISKFHCRLDTKHFEDNDLGATVKYMETAQLKLFQRAMSKCNLSSYILELEKVSLKENTHQNRKAYIL